MSYASKNTLLSLDIGSDIIKAAIVRRLKNGRRAVNVVFTLLICIFALLMITPFIWMVSASFKQQRDVLSVPIRWIPSYWYPDNYLRVLGIGIGKATNYHFLLAYWNSIKVAGSVPDEVVKGLLDKAYETVLKSLSKKKQKEILGIG